MKKRRNVWKFSKENEQRQLEELRKKRNTFTKPPQRTIQLSEVVSQPPAQNVSITIPVSGFQRSSTGNIGRKIPNQSRSDRIKDIRSK